LGGEAGSVRAAPGGPVVGVRAHRQEQTQRKRDENGAHAVRPFPSGGTTCSKVAVRETAKRAAATRGWGHDYPASHPIRGNSGFTLPPGNSARIRKSSGWPGCTHTSSKRTDCHGCLKLKLL